MNSFGRESDDQLLNNFFETKRLKSSREKRELSNLLFKTVKKFCDFDVTSRSFLMMINGLEQKQNPKKKPYVLFLSEMVCDKICDHEPPFL